MDFTNTNMMQYGLSEKTPKYPSQSGHMMNKECWILRYVGGTPVFDGLIFKKKPLLRVIPTMTFIHFLTGKSSGILSDISSGILFGISIWHIFWHMFWHIFWHIFWHSIWQIFWHSIWHIFWHSIWHIFWHSIWHSIWHIFWHIF